MAVTLDLDLDASGYLRGVDRAKRASGGFSNSIGGLVTKFAGAAAGAAAVASAVGAVTVKMLDVAASVEDSNDKFRTLFGEGSDSVNKWAQDWAGLVGVTDRAARDMLSGTAAIVQGMGMSGDAAADMSKQLVQVAGDLASFNDVSNERATGALQAALTGERERLKELGIVIHEADVQARAFAMTGKESAKALTQQEKAAATMALVMERAGVAIGDAERTSDSLTKVMGRLRSSFGNIMDTIAPVIAGALRPMIDELAKLAEWVRINREAIREWVTFAIAGVRSVGDIWVNSLQAISGPIRAIAHLIKGEFTEAWDAANDGLQFIPKSIGDVREEMKNARIQIMDATAATVPYAAAMAGGGSGAASVADTSSVAGATKVAKEAVEKFNDAMRSMPALTGVAAERAAANAKAMSDRLSEEFAKVRGGVKGLSTELATLIEAPAIKFKDAGGGNFFDKLFGDVQGKIKSVSNSITGFLKDTFGSKLGGAIIDGLGAAIGGPLAGLVSNFAGKALGALKGLFTGFKKTIEADLSALTAKGYEVTAEFTAEYNRLLNSSGQAAADHFAKLWAHRQRQAAEEKRLLEEETAARWAAWQEETRIYENRIAFNARVTAANEAQARKWQQTHWQITEDIRKHEETNALRQIEIAREAQGVFEAKYRRLIEWSKAYNATVAENIRLEEQRKRNSEALNKLIGAGRFGGRDTGWDALSFDEKVREAANPNSRFFGRNPYQERIDAGQRGNDEFSGPRDEYVPSDAANAEETELQRIAAGIETLNSMVAGGALGEVAARDTADRVTIGAPAAGFAR